MNFCKHILIVALTLSLATQSFAMEIVRNSYAGRMGAYNTSPTDDRIPEYTGTLNQLFEKGLAPGLHQRTKKDKF